MAQGEVYRNVERLDTMTEERKEELAYNAKLQQKKNMIRKALKEKGVMKKGATNDYDHYSYFSESQYKLLFTELFVEARVELSFTELEYNLFEGSEKQSNGRMPKLKFILTDIDTGYAEETVITGEGIDKGDKAGYKAYTGALKYYLANTFMVATGDDPEKDSPTARMNTKTEKPATDKQKALIQQIADRMGRPLNEKWFANLTMKQASDFITEHKDK